MEPSLFHLSPKSHLRQFLKMTSSESSDHYAVEQAAFGVHHDDFETTAELKAHERKLRETHGRKGNLKPLDLSKSFVHQEEIKHRFELTDLQYVGKGGYGTVFKGKDSHDKTFALKSISPRYNDKLYQRALFMPRVNREIDMLNRIHHPNVVTFFGHMIIKDYRDMKHAVLMTEYLHETMLMLCDYTVGIPVTKRIIEQVGAGLLAMHKMGIAHHDLKLDNIMVNRPIDFLVDSKGTIRHKLRKCQFKIIDLGMARNYDGPKSLETRFRGGTRVFCAPEKLSGQPYDPYLSDAFSLGVILLQSWVGLKDFDKKKKQLKSRPEFWFQREDEREPNWEHFGVSLLNRKVSLQALIFKLLVEDKERIGVEQLLEDVKKC